jgi:hypothetical protein
MLLSEYTVSLLEYEKVCIDFAIPDMNEYEMNEFVRFFKKHKKETFISGTKKSIDFIIIHWSRWAEFLIKMRFRDSAKAFCEIIQQLDKEINPPLNPLEYLDRIAKAKMIITDEKKKIVEDEKTKKEREEKYEKMKIEEINRLIRNKIKREENDFSQYEENIRKFLNIRKF